LNRSEHDITLTFVSYLMSQSGRHGCGWRLEIKTALGNKMNAHLQISLMQMSRDSGTNTHKKFDSERGKM
jgi:hypothetical protein